MTEEAFYTRLKNRGLVRVGGADARLFLQGLITNDVNKLDSQESVYSCLLTPQGKFLFDFFLSLDGDDILMECEGGERAQALGRKLSMYKLRSDISISVEEDVEVFAVFGAQIGLADPRHEGLGYRSFIKPEALVEMPFDVWDEKRISLCIPDGSRDLLVDKSTMDEARMDDLHAVDYDKGCYMGQELTARMYYRGLGKKHLEVVKIDALPEGADLRSFCGAIGLALIRS